MDRHQKLGSPPWKASLLMLLMFRVARFVGLR